MERDRQTLNLRIAGVDYDTIADRLGYANRSGPWKAVQRVLDNTLRAPAEDIRSLELARYDAWTRAIAGECSKGNLGAITVALRISERRCRLLGLDAPTLVKVDIEARVRAYAEQLGLNPDLAVSEALAILNETRGQVGGSVRAYSPELD
jgi:hypothetical protein